MFEVIDSELERVFIIKCDNIGTNLRILEESADDFIKNDNRDMVIDLKEQEIMSSLLLASLIRIKRGLSIEHRELRLKNCNMQIYRCIEMSGLESFFSFSN